MGLFFGYDLEIMIGLKKGQLIFVLSKRVGKLSWTFVCFPYL